MFVNNVDVLECETYAAETFFMPDAHRSYASI